MKPQFRRPLLAAAMLAAPCLATPAQAAFPLDDPFAGLPSLAPAELAGARGGMMINGIPVNFAVVIRTTVEGAVAQGLQTILTVDDNGGLASASTTPIGTDQPVAQSGGGQVTVAGGTTILHQVIDDQVQSLISNTLNGAQVTHHTEVNVELPGFSAVAQSWQASALAARLGRDSALLSGLAR